ncbi:hypothetical protein HID58_034170 [Brassica napus]|uniref:Nascent polypeptide-associated complex subunit beta n=1 Tax=Brassica napus TaxID=3708 RepID=A0ABQ8C196_BRANA|nr:hypothetical protein HID58_034170 [Brassica napus]
MEDLDALQEAASGTAEDDPHTKDVGDKGLLAGDEEKKGTRKLLLKQTVMAAGTSKKKFVQAILSQSKNVQARQGKHHGERIRLP